MKDETKKQMRLIDALDVLRAFSSGPSEINHVVDTYGTSVLEDAVRLVAVDEIRRVALTSPTQVYPHG